MTNIKLTTTFFALVGVHITFACTHGSHILATYLDDYV